MLRRVRVYDPSGSPYRGAIVALYKSSGQVIGQGLTDNQGLLDVYGASENDILRSSSFDGGLAGSVQVPKDAQNLRIDLRPVGKPTRTAAQANDAIPHLRVIAEPGTVSGQTNLLVAIDGFGPGADPSIVVTAPDGETSFAPVMSYHSDEDSYQGNIGFGETKRGTGRIRAVGGANSVIRLQSTYRLQHVTNNQGYDVFSDDGNLNLRIDSGSLPGTSAYVVVMSPGALPGPLPAGLTLVGDAYDVTISGALAELAKPASLELHYDRALVGTTAAPAGLAIYRWDPNSQAWQAVAGDLEQEHKSMTSAITALGTYALLAPPGDWTKPSSTIFLPVVYK
jgi:hypothetical protein